MDLTLTKYNILQEPVKLTYAQFEECFTTGEFEEWELDVTKYRDGHGEVFCLSKQVGGEEFILLKLQSPNERGFTSIQTHLPHKVALSALISAIGNEPLRRQFGSALLLNGTELLETLQLADWLEDDELDNFPIFEFNDQNRPTAVYPGEILLVKPGQEAAAIGLQHNLVVTFTNGKNETVSVAVLTPFSDPALLVTAANIIKRRNGTTEISAYFFSHSEIFTYSYDSILDLLESNGIVVENQMQPEFSYEGEHLTPGVLDKNVGMVWFRPPSKIIAAPVIPDSYASVYSPEKYRVAFNSNIDSTPFPGADTLFEIAAYVSQIPKVETDEGTLYPSLRTHGRICGCAMRIYDGEKLLGKYEAEALGKHDKTIS